jgi:DNA gyrase inhibitor GyrI
MNVLIFAALLIALLLLIAISVGSFRKPLIEKSQMPGYTIMGIPYQGSYQKIGPSIRKIAEIAKRNGWKPQIIAVYFDNPKEVKETDCRALAAIRVNNEQMSILQNENLETLIIPQGKAIVCHWKGKSLPKRIMGAIRVYPPLQQFVANENILEKVQFVYEVYEPHETIFVMQYQE